MYSLSKEQSVVSRETIFQKSFFFSELCLFFVFPFHSLSSTPQPSVGTRMRCSCFTPCLESFLLFTCILIFKLLSANSVILEESKKFVIWGRVNHGVELSFEIQKIERQREVMMHVSLISAVCK